MKKRNLLFLMPALAMVMAGCDLFSKKPNTDEENKQQQESKLETAYKAAEALTTSDPTTEAYEFSGVIVATTGNSFFVQNGDYGIEVYNYASNEVSVGKNVTVTATLKNYNGLVETDTVSSIVFDGIGEVPSGVTLSSNTELQALNGNVLVDSVELEVISKLDKWDSSTTKNWKVNLGGTEATLSLDKYAFDTNEKAKIKDLEAGSHFVAYDLISSIYKGTRQLSFNSQSVFGVGETQARPAKRKSISVSGEAEKTTFFAGKEYSFNGFSVDATLTDDTTQTNISKNEYNVRFNKLPEIGDTSFTITVELRENANITTTKVVEGITVRELVSPITAGVHTISAIGDDGKTYYMQVNGSNNPVAVEDMYEATGLDFQLVDGEADVYTIGIVGQEGKYLSLVDNNSGIKVSEEATNWTIESGTLEASGEFDIKASVGNVTRWITLYNGNNYKDWRSYNSATASNRKVNTSVGSYETRTCTQITVDTTNVTKTYYVGESFSTNGLVVTATFDKGEPKNVTDYTIDLENGTEFTEAVASKTVTVTYAGKTASFTIEVLEARTIQSIEIKGDLTKKEYEVGDDWDLTGLTFEYKYNVGDNTPIDPNEITLSCNPEKASDTTITSITVTATSKGEPSYSGSKEITGLKVNAASTAVEYVIVNDKKSGKTFSSTGANTLSIAGIELATEGVKTGSGDSQDKNYGYFMINNGYIASTSAPEGKYITKIDVTYTSGTGETGMVVIEAFATSTAAKSSAAGTKVVKSGTLSWENTEVNKSLCYFTISNVASKNAQIASIVVTFDNK